MKSLINLGNLFNWLMRFEDDELDQDETLTLFSYLIKSGMVYRLQGYYGREASRMIQEGIINDRGDVQ